MADNLYNFLDNHVPEGGWGDLSPASNGTLNDAQAPRTAEFFNPGNTIWPTDELIQAAIKSILPDHFIAWSGCTIGRGALADKYYFTGGGHNDGGDSSLFEYDLNAAAAGATGPDNSGVGAWARITDPPQYDTTAHPSWPTVTGVNNYPQPTIATSDNKQSLGQITPWSGHTYNGLEVEADGARIWLYPLAIFSPNAVAGNGLWYLDVASNNWVLDSANPAGVGIAQPGTSVDSPLGSTATDHIAVMSGQLGTNENLYRYNKTTKTWTKFAGWFFGGAGTRAGRILVPSLAGTAGEWDALAFHDSTSNNWTRYPQWLTGSNVNSQAVSGAPSGDTPAQAEGSGGAYRAVDNAIYCLNDGDGNNANSVQKFTWTGVGPHSVTCANQVVTGTVAPGLGNDQTSTGEIANGINNKWRYSRKYDCFVVALGRSEASNGLWVWKPYGWDPEPQVPTGPDLSPGAAQLVTGV